ncbi:MAG: hypothetical protein HY077_00220 [Elusimicrobia bacterium]|nr:hypothetical protein [Elusimicrobiota bacterium]
MTTKTIWLLCLLSPACTLPRARAEVPAPLRPDLVLRLNQELFETQGVQEALDAGKRRLDPGFHDAFLDFRNDGIHLKFTQSLLWKEFEFDIILRLLWTGRNTFEAHLQKFDVSGKLLLFHFKVDLKTLKAQLFQFFKLNIQVVLLDAIDLKYVGNTADQSLVFRGTVNVGKLVPLPAAADLDLSGIQTQDRLLVLELARRP